MERKPEEIRSTHHWVEHDIKIAGHEAFVDIKRDIRNVLNFALPRVEQEDKDMLFADTVKTFDPDVFIEQYEADPSRRKEGAIAEGKRELFKKAMGSEIIRRIEDHEIFGSLPEEQQKNFTQAVGHLL